jgi:SAM-dependent methyltransferase
MAVAYVLGHTRDEVERLRRQARLWEEATGRLLDRVGLAPGAQCLDAGCGPGEVMRLLAQRVGPAGQVTGLDVDGAAGSEAVAALHASGHSQCSFVHADLTRDDPFPSGRFDLVYARLLLLHLDDPVAALRRLWAWTAPGGHLVVQDFDFRSVAVHPPLDVFDEFSRVVHGTFVAAGRNVHLGHCLPAMLEEAGIGAPDGTDVAGRLDRFDRIRDELEALYRSLLPAALSLGVTTPALSDAWLEELANDTYEAHHGLWPLLVGVHKRKPIAP